MNIHQFLTRNNITLMIAILGCITGCASLIINFIRFHKERFHLKIDCSVGPNIFFKKPPEHRVITNLQAVAYVKFINQSSTPITIYDITVTANGETTVCREFNDKYITLLNGTHSTSTPEFIQIDMSNQFSVPMRIDVYDAACLTMFFPFFPDTDKDTSELVLVFKTTKGDMSKKVLLTRHQPKQ